MRWYNIFSGILLILSIIDFALAAPVLVQEKRQACVDVVNIPRDAMTVLGKRADGELEKLAEEFLKTSGKPAESSDVHVSSNPVPSGPDHGLMNVAQAPVPNPALSTANPNLPMNPPGPSMDPESPALLDSESYGRLFETQGIDEALPTQTSSGHDLELTLAPLGPDRGSTKVVQKPAPNPASSTANLNPSMEPPGPSIEPVSPALSDSESLFNTQGNDDVHKPLPTQTSSGHDLELTLAPPGLHHGSAKVVQEPAPNPASLTADPNSLMKSSEYKWLFEPEGSDGSHKPQGTAPQPNPKKRPWTDMSPYQNWDWATMLNRPWPLKESGQTSKYQHVQQPDPVPSTTFDSDLSPPESPEPLSVVYPPFMFTGLPTKSEHDVVHPSFKITGLPTEPKHDVVHAPFTITGLPTEPKHDAVNPPFTITGLPTEPKHDVVDPPFTITGLPTEPKHDAVNPLFTITGLPTEPKHDVVHPPFTITGLPKQFEYEEVNRPPPNLDPELHLDHQSLTTDSRPVDVGNTAQRELQPDGRSLDPGELPPLAEPK